MLNSTDNATKFSLPNTDGETISLEEIMDGRYNVLLVFLRHLG